MKLSGILAALTRNGKQDLFLIALFGLTSQALLAARFEQPTYMDAYYYATNGQRLAHGYGFTERVIWQFLDEPTGIPALSHTYWMPLASLLAAGGDKLLGSYRGMQLPFWILAGLLPCLSYIISRKLSGLRRHAWTAALLTATGGFYINFFGQPSTFAPFAWAGGLSLFAVAQATRRRASIFFWFLAGLMAGFGHLARADGALLLLTGILVWALGIRRGKNRKDATATTSLGRGHVVGILWMLVGYLVVMGGWYVHNWRSIGRLLPTVGTQTIFLTTYDDLFAYGRSFGLQDLLDWGWENILSSRLQGLSVAGQTFITASCLIFLTPFVLWAWWRFALEAEKWEWLRPMTYYALALFLTMSLVFTFPGGRGGLFHSSAALWPWFMALAASGIDLAVDWFASKLPHWQPERAKPTFAALFVGMAAIASLSIGIARSPDNDEAGIYEQIGRQLPDEAIVMVGDAPGFYYHTGFSAVSVPNEPVEVLLQVADRYGVTHLVLDEDRPQPLGTFYDGQIQSPRVRWLDAWDDYKLYAIRPAE